MFSFWRTTTFSCIDFSGTKIEQSTCEKLVLGGRILLSILAGPMGLGIQNDEASLFLQIELHVRAE